MSAHSLNVNAIVALNGKLHAILRAVKGDKWLLRELSSGRTCEYAINKLLNKYANGDMAFLPDNPASGAIHRVNPPTNFKPALKQHSSNHKWNES